MKHKLYFMFAFVLAANANHLTAQSLRLDDVNVYGEYTQTVSNLRNTITTLSAEQIQALPVTSVNELLNLLAGVDIRTRGANGVQADISVRGGTNDQVLILLNGINITDPRTGHANLDLPVDLASITRIEVLQGTAIDHFGLNAFAGAVNIITIDNVKQKQPSSLSHRISLAGGAHGYFAPAYTIKGNNDNTQWMAATNYNRSTGYMHNTDYDLGNIYTSGSISDTHSGNWQWQAGGSMKQFGSNAFYTLKFPDQYEKTKTILASGKWSKSLGNWNIESNLYYRLHHDTWYLYRPDYDTYPDGYKPNRHITQLGGINAKTQYTSLIGNTSFGIELREEHILSNVLGEERKNISESDIYRYSKNRFNINYFAQQTFIWADYWTAQLGIAGNYNTMFGNNYTYNARLSYQYAPQSNVYIGTGRALRLPTFTDLYYKSVTQIANPHLKPENSYNFELGTQYLQRINDQWTMQLEAAAYYRIGNNIIDWIKQPADEKWQSTNHTRVDAAGTEVALRFHNRQWDINASYAFCHLNHSMQPEYKNYISKYALDYLRHKATLQLKHPIGKGFGGMWTFSYQQRHGEYIDINNDVQSYKPVCLLDGRLFWKNKWTEVYAECSNILNISYYDYGGIAQPGRWLKAGIIITLNHENKSLADR